MTKTIVLCLLALSLPTPVSAGLYRCKQIDGRTRFQDVPCSTEAARANGAVDGADSAASALSISPGITVYKHTKQAQPVVEPPRAEDRVSALNRKLDAHNKAVDCDQARHNLGVLSEQRPVYRYDDKGERQYIDDADREREVVVARQRVSQSCK
ncbi:MAG: DUF4124 domain-containing protein [Stagnimonas sp.]|nr:DUF4124 domain-containing protein [Stagnimonas sp.]